MPTQKDEFIQQLKKQYDDLNYRWSRERDKFEADLQHTEADAKQEFEAKREEYRKFRSQMKEKIVELDVASDNAWPLPRLAEKRISPVPVATLLNSSSRS